VFVRTTLDIDDALYRSVKAKAALEGRTVTQLVEASLRALMQSSPEKPVMEPAWKRFAGLCSGPEWEEDNKFVQAEMEAAFGGLESEDLMSSEELAESLKSKR